MDDFAKDDFTNLQVRAKPGMYAIPSEVTLMYRTAAKNAKARGIEWRLSADDMAVLWSQSGGKCAISGLHFDWRARGHGERRPWAGSLDRVRSDGPYSFDNCRLVCVIANLAMNEWGADALHKLAHAIAFKNCQPEKHKAPAVNAAPKRYTGGKMLKIGEVMQRTGLTRPPLYAQMQFGVFVRPVKIGPRAAAWPEAEVEQLIAATVAGLSTERMRALVDTLHMQRSGAA